MGIGSLGSGSGFFDFALTLARQSMTAYWEKMD
jgi:hypothetical protein